MTRRRIMPDLALLTLITSLAAVFALAVPALAQSAPGAKTWKVPRTADGHADLEGVWNNNTATPFERPSASADKAVFLPSEVAALEKQEARRFADRPPQPGSPAGFNEFWFDPPPKVLANGRNSLVIDPPDGRVPPLTQAAQAHLQERQAYARLHPADGPEDRPLFDRCLHIGGPPMTPLSYNSNYEIVQGAGYVAILSEMIHDARVIPTDGRPHLPSNILQWNGDGRGHWEGDRLVVETTNFTDKTFAYGVGWPSRFRADENLRLVERFTRVDANTIDYQFTIDDPTVFTKPWTASIPLTRVNTPVFEYACQEGNYALTDILAGARAQEREAAGASQ